VFVAQEKERQKGQKRGGPQKKKKKKNSAGGKIEVRLFGNLGLSLGISHAECSQALSLQGARACHTRILPLFARAGFIHLHSRFSDPSLSDSL
jgi:hypothetical protein